MAATAGPVGAREGTTLHGLVVVVTVCVVAVLFAGTACYLAVRGRDADALLAAAAGALSTAVALLARAKTDPVPLPVTPVDPVPDGP